MSVAVIFGGTGFIGAFFAKHLLDNGYNKVYLADHESPAAKQSVFRKRLVEGDDRIVYVNCDVRKRIDIPVVEEISLIANFAAVHREPGHYDHEYFETNILGAENVCAWAQSIHCNDIIFTSSISPYGPSESEKDESSLPCPVTAYGGSKLAAEKIHMIWQAADSINRRLVIIRPGVVFGPGEGGNVSRLIKAVLGRYFFYMGNQSTRKAGVYVKELCNALFWVYSTQQLRKERVTLFNMSMNPGPSIKEYAEAVCKVARVHRFIPAVPYFVLLILAYCIEVFAKPLGIVHPFSPVRIKKLVRSNNIKPAFLVEHGYAYQYTLEEAFQDWKCDCPEEWR